MLNYESVRHDLLLLILHTPSESETRATLNHPLTGNINWPVELSNWLVASANEFPHFASVILNVLINFARTAQRLCLVSRAEAVVQEANTKVTVESDMLQKARRTLLKIEIDNALLRSDRDAVVRKSIIGLQQSMSLIKFNGDHSSNNLLFLDRWISSLDSRARDLLSVTPEASYQMASESAEALKISLLSRLGYKNWPYGIGSSNNLIAAATSVRDFLERLGRQHARNASRSSLQERQTADYVLELYSAYLYFQVANYIMLDVFNNAPLSQLPRANLQSLRTYIRTTIKLMGFNRRNGNTTQPDSINLWGRDIRYQMQHLIDLSAAIPGERAELLIVEASIARVLDHELHGAIRLITKAERLMSLSPEMLQIRMRLLVEHSKCHQLFSQDAAGLQRRTDLANPISSDRGIDDVNGPPDLNEAAKRQTLAKFTLDQLDRIIQDSSEDLHPNAIFIGQRADLTLREKAKLEIESRRNLSLYWRHQLSQQREHLDLLENELCQLGLKVVSD